MDLIRNPRYPRPRPDGSPSRPVILVPMTRNVMCCVFHAQQYMAMQAADPHGTVFLPDGQLGRHERPKVDKNL